MATIESKFGLGTGNRLTHPNQLMPFTCDAAAEVWNGVSNGGDSNSTEAQFWTDVSNNGVAVDSAFTAATPKQILTTSTPGELLAIVGPTATGAETTTFTIVLNGVTYTSPAISVTSGLRVGLTCILTPYFNATPADAYKGTGAFSAVSPALNSAKTTAQNEILLPSWSSPHTWNSPRLSFLTLTVSITHSANVTDTASNGRQSGVLYRNLLTWT